MRPLASLTLGDERSQIVQSLARIETIHSGIKYRITPQNQCGSLLQCRPTRRTTSSQMRSTALRKQNQNQITPSPSPSPSPNHPNLHPEKADDLPPGLEKTRPQTPKAIQSVQEFSPRIARPRTANVAPHVMHDFCPTTTRISNPHRMDHEPRIR